MIVTDERVLAFVSERLGSFIPPFTCMGIERDGRIIAGAIFNCFEGCDVHVSAAGTGWTRRFFRALGEYVYGTLGCERMTYTMQDEAVASFVERLGGKREGLLRSHFGPGQDAIIVGILRDEYLYLAQG